ncbi:RecB family exonuclease [Streptomonospora nanhaiensis]|uniref:Putative RecB family exonuclease n=1 Tax=Streptomonospora nanhaiensis TaxID=1323731 RepID=A0A853BGR4_9ACTN|nr:RecB family exonuclease [Streptomonospora nanhaiensis]MBX9389712.1 RecB family exonuclease [Streptomonospora nanhaiensis]NYI94559.1 putative RecB family exonuclease [Streptomonospora nanhaiensis]
MDSPPATPLVSALSPSRAADFLQCPLLFRFRVIDRLPEKPSAAALRGTLVHAVLERLFELPADTRTPRTALSLLEPQWERLRASRAEAVAGLFASDAELAAWLAEARTLIGRYFEMEQPQRLEPHKREMRLDVTLESGLRLRGYLDRLDVAPTGQIRIVDYKTGKSPQPRFEQKARFQIFFYAVMLWRELGEIPTRLQLMYLGDGGVRWYEPTEQELLAAEAEILGIWRQIEDTARSGVWSPRRSRLCDWCDHRERCPEFGGTPPPMPDSLPVV